MMSARNRLPRRSALVLGVTSALTLTACGSSGGIAATSYAQKVCSALTGFEARLMTSSSALQTGLSKAKSDVPAARTATLAFVAGSVANARKLSADVAAAGYPKGSGGKKVAQVFTTESRKVESTFISQLASIQAIPATKGLQFDAAQKNLSDATRGVAANLLDGLNSVGAFGDTALNDAFRSNATCSSL